MAFIVDFKDVKSRGGRVRVPEGDYRAQVNSYKIGESKKSGNSMVVWEFEGKRGKLKGKKLKDYTTLTADSLWKLMNLLEAMGLSVPPKKVDLEKILKKTIDKELGLTLTDEEYENKISSKISSYLPLEDLEDEDDEDDGVDLEDEESSKPKRKKKEKATNDEEEDDEIEDLDLDEL